MGFKCEICGESNLVKKDGLFVCESCGTKYTYEEVKKIISNNGSNEDANNQNNNEINVNEKMVTIQSNDKNNNDSHNVDIDVNNDKSANKDDAIMFKSSFIFSEDDYRALNDCIMDINGSNRKGKGALIVSFIFNIIIFTALAIGLSISTGSFVFLVFIIFGIIIPIIGMLLGRGIKEKKINEYYDNIKKNVDGKPIHNYEFYEDHFVFTFNNSQSCLKYSNVAHIVLLD